MMPPSAAPLWQFSPPALVLASTARSKESGGGCV
jgi:hypothetical protein